MKKKIGAFDVVNVLLMLGLVCLTLYPFLYMINVSLSTDIFIMRNEVSLWPKGLTWSWYHTVFADHRLFVGYRNTILYTALGTTIALIITSAGAYALAQKEMIFRKGFTLAIVFTILFGGGMIPSFLVVREVGILDTIWAMVIPGAVSTFHLLVFRSFFEGIPEELIEAGKIDGLNDVGLFARIVMPLSKPAYAAIGLFEAVGLWNNFYKAILYLKSPDLYPLTMVLRDLIIRGQIDSDLSSHAVAGGEMIVSDGLKFATIIVSTLPILMLYPFLQKYFVKGVMLGAMKG